MMVTAVLKNGWKRRPRSNFIALSVMMVSDGYQIVSTYAYKQWLPMVMIVSDG